MTGVSPETAQRLLDLELPGNDAKAPTVRAWLAALLKAAWCDREVFKHPFGWSGAWEDDIYRALIAGGIVPGEIDEDGCLTGDFDYDAADRVILAAIEATGKPAAVTACPEPHPLDHRCFDCATDEELADSIPPRGPGLE